MAARKPVIESTVTAATAAVHGLVIGVGRYDDAGVPGLDGAAGSALAFAEWLRAEHAPPGLVRGSLDVLASSKDGSPLEWQGKKLDPPTLANVRRAVDALHARVDESPGSMVVFYFCGHGIEMGGLRSLMLQDVDPSSKTDPFSNAIAFDDFVTGMGACAPRQQLFVLDACRELPLGFGKWDDGVGLGQPLVRANLKRLAQLGPRTHVVLEGASSTQKAWAGAAGGWFTDAMLTVLKGAAGDNRFTSSEDEYSISTRDIADIIKLLVKGGFIDPPAGPQNPVRRGEGDLDFHVPKQPVVPVLVTRKVPSTNVGAQFVAVRGVDEMGSHACTGEEPWRAKLPVGDYVFRRDVDAVPARVSVPAKKVELP